MTSLPTAGAPHPDDVERVLISAATAVGAERYWYCRGDDLEHLTPLYAGRFGKDGVAERCFSTKPSPTLPLPPERAPTNIQALAANGEMLCIPVCDAGKNILGRVLLQRPLARDFGERGPFSDAERAIAHCIVTANAKYIEPNGYSGPKKHKRWTAAEDFLDKLKSLFLAGLRDKHPETASHVQRMAELVENMADEIDKTSLPFKITHPRLRLLKFLALLHDGDKYQVPDSVLGGGREIRDDPAQWQRMQDHAFNSGQILDLPLLDTLELPKGEPAIMVSAHHMQARGTGYPYGCSETLDARGRITHEGDYFPPYVNEEAFLAGKPAPVKLPFEVGLFQLCDVFEAMTAKRHYRIHQHKVRASEILQQMFEMARREEINPYLFYFFVQSQTLSRYTHTSDFEHAHLAQGTDEDHILLELRRRIINDEPLKALALRYSSEQQPLLFTKLSTEHEQHLPVIEDWETAKSMGGHKAADRMTDAAIFRQIA